MAERMKILIAYDGSECSDLALDDLLRAGLPATAEAVVMTVAEVFLPPPVNEEVGDTFPLYVPEGVRSAHERAAHEVLEAGVIAERAAERVRKSFPGWTVRAEACADSPAWAVVKRADEWEPDLVVVGSHGHSSLGGRLILGSVSQRVLYESPCSVRVARGTIKKEDSPLRIIVGADGSPDSEATINEVAARAWPKGCEVRVVAVLDTVISITPDASQPSVVKWVEADDDAGWGWVRQAFESWTEKLRTTGLTASTILRKGNPKHVLVEEAEEWGADSVFVGAKGMRGVERFLMGSVSSAVAARAHCSVEVVRPKLPPPAGPR